MIESMITACVIHMSPVVICGEPGAGKISVMAKVSSLLPEWLGAKDARVIVRFLGTSTESSTTKDLLISLCAQIHRLNGHAGGVQQISTVGMYLHTAQYKEKMYFYK